MIISAYPHHHYFTLIHNTQQSISSCHLYSLNTKSIHSQLTTKDMYNRQLTGDYYYKKTFFGLFKVLMVEITGHSIDPIFCDIGPQFKVFVKATQEDKHKLNIKE